jgi:hypothetical protein
MKVISLIVAVSAIVGVSAFVPQRISYSRLMAMADNTDNDATMAIRDALSDTGILSITGLGGSSSDWMQIQQECLLRTASTSSSATSTLGDGSVRQTVAKQTIAGFVEHDLPCPDLVAATHNFRAATDQVVDQVAKVLDQVFFIDNTQDHGSTPTPPLLSTNTKTLHTISDIVREGEQLEHFHGYTTTNADHDATIMATISTPNTPTLELHTDEGLLLAFTPARWIMTTGTGGTGQAFSFDNMKKDKSFQVKLPNGSVEPLELSLEEDDLIILLGEGVNVYVNPHVDIAGEKLRAVPHSLHLNGNDRNDNGGIPEGATRLWYGRMVLPPPTTVVHAAPLHQDKDPLVESATTRQLQDSVASDCDATDVFCWHRCFTEVEQQVAFGVGINSNETMCESAVAEMACANSCGHVWAGDEHNPIFQPRCVENVTLFQTADLLCIDGEEHDNPDGHHDDDGSGSRVATFGVPLFIGMAIVAVSAVLWGW